MSQSVPSGLTTPEGAQFAGLESIFGPLLLGGFLGTLIFGMTCIQTYDYYITSSGDRLHLKSIVGLLFVIDAFQTAMNIHVLYFYLVKNFGNAAALLSATWSSSCRSLVIALSSFIVRSMFCRRIYLVSRKNVLLTAWIMALATGDLIVGTIITAKALIALNTQSLQNITHLLYLGFALGVSSDISLTIALCWLLYSVKTGVRKTDSLVKVLIRYVVTTGLLVCVDGTLGLIFYILLPEKLIFLGFFQMLGQLYINAYLASLNARENLRKGQTDVNISLSRMSYQEGRDRQTALTNGEDKLSFYHSESSRMGAMSESSSNGPRTHGQETKDSTISQVV